VRRQQTLRASVDWSHALLTEPERILFRRLAVFMGGFDLDAGQAVGAGTDVERYQLLDQLSLLVDKSLVVAEGARGAMRYRLLETVRQYALEKLGESGEADDVRIRHRDHYASKAARSDTFEDGGHVALVEWAELEIDNLRAAFTWSLENSEVDSALKIASALQPFWQTEGQAREGLAWFSTGIADGHTEVTPAVRARALADRATLGALLGAMEYMTHTDEALAIARDIDDPTLLVSALIACGMVELYNVETARQHFTEAIDLARDQEDRLSLGRILSWLAFIDVFAGEPGRAYSAAEEGRDIADSIGDGFVLRQCRVWRGLALLMKGQLVEAAQELSVAVAESEAAQDRYTKSIGEIGRGIVLAFHGDTHGAHTAGEAALEAATSFGGFHFEDTPYAILAYAALAAGEAEAARTACEAAWERTQRQDFLHQICPMAESALACGDFDTARLRADEDISIEGWWATRALTTRARVLMTRSEPEQAERDAYQALAIAADRGAFLGTSDTLECLAALAHRRQNQRKAARLLGASEAIRKRMGHIRFRIYDAEFDELVAAVREVLGEEDFDAGWAEGEALSTEEAIAYAQRGRGERNRPSSGWASLTPTELDVARLVSEGLANKQIATQLFVSPRTVQTHLTHIYTKLGLTSRVQLAQEAARRT
jgi:DNA-binding NarL/FixJ family response regulator